MVVLNDSRIFRLICLTGVFIIVINLFWIGEKPVAVGLFPGSLDKVAHFATYGLIAALLWLSFKRGHPLFIIAVVSAIGMADEFHQRFLPGRSASLEDFAIDSFAALVVVYIMKHSRKSVG